MPASLSSISSFSAIPWGFKLIFIYLGLQAMSFLISILRLDENINIPLLPATLGTGIASAALIVVIDLFLMYAIYYRRRIGVWLGVVYFGYYVVAVALSYLALVSLVSSDTRNPDIAGLSKFLVSSLWLPVLLGLLYLAAAVYFYRQRSYFTN